MKRRDLLAGGVAGAVSLVTGSPGFAQAAFPDRPLRMVVPFPPGGPTDIMGRTAARVMSERLGQNIVVENRAGAGGNVGTDLVAKAAPDGYTIGLSAISSLAISAHLYRSLPFKVQTDLAPISLVGTTPCALIVHPGAPFNDLKSMVAWARANPGKLNYATSGVGTANHLAAELLQSVAGIQLTHVPYKGASQIVPDLLSGTIPMSMESSLVTTLQYVSSGKLRALAVTSAQRSPALPEVPTIAESGYPGFDVETWFGLIAPAGTPAAVVDRLQQAWAEGSQQAEARSAFENIAANLRVQTPAQFGAFIAAEDRRWGDLISKNGIKVE